MIKKIALLFFISPIGVYAQCTCNHHDHRNFDPVKIQKDITEIDRQKSLSVHYRERANRDVLSTDLNRTNLDRTRRSNVIDSINHVNVTGRNIISTIQQINNIFKK